MAIRTKTIEYAFPWNTSSLNSATRYEFPTTSIFIPETSSRIFRSVFIELNYRDDSNTAAAQTAALIGIKLHTASFNDQTTSTSIQQTSEHQSLVLLRDATSYFANNFGTTNTTASCQVAAQITNMTTANHCAKLYITYDYDDVQNTRIKTVRIPLRSFSGRGNTGSLEIGADTRIPVLDTFLPEVSKTYRNIWFELYSNEARSNATNMRLGLWLDSETPVTSANNNGTLNSAVFRKIIWPRNDMTTNATHQLFMATSGSTPGAFTNMGAVLGVTYEYVSSSTSQSMNSLMIPIIDEVGFVGTSGSSGIISSSAGVYASRAVQDLRISEPGPISFKQSGILFFYNTIADNTAANEIDPIVISINNEAPVSYDVNVGSAPCGQYSIMHSIPTASITLNRGLNTFTTNFLTRQTPSSTVTNLTGVGYINYVSNIATGSDSVHNQTRLFAVATQSVINTIQRYDYTFTPVAQVGTNFRTTGLSFAILMNYGGQNGANSLTARTTNTERLVIGTGWVPLYESVLNMEGAGTAHGRGIFTSFTRSRSQFLRYTGDPETNLRLDLQTSRIYRVESTGPTATNNSDNSMVGGVYCLWTYHNIATAVSRSISGFSTGNGSGLNINIYESGSDELVYTATSVSGGNYSFLAYDPNRTLYAVAHDSASGAVGRSKYFTPVV